MKLRISATDGIVLKLSKLEFNYKSTRRKKIDFGNELTVLNESSSSRVFVILTKWAFGQRVRINNSKFRGVNERRIYTTFVLGTALQNSGTRANRFGHGPLDLHDKICSSSFSVDFSNGTPKTRTALLNL